MTGAVRYGDRRGTARRHLAWALTVPREDLTDADRVAYASARGRLAATINGVLGDYLADPDVLTGREAQHVAALQQMLAGVATVSQEALTRAGTPAPRAVDGSIVPAVQDAIDHAAPPDVSGGLVFDVAARPRGGQVAATPVPGPAVLVPADGPVSRSQVVAHLAAAATAAADALRWARAHRDGDVFTGADGQLRQEPTAVGRQLLRGPEARALLADVADLARGLAEVDERMIPLMHDPAPDTAPTAAVAAQIRLSTGPLLDTAQTALALLSGPVRGELDDLTAVPALADRQIGSPEQLADSLETLIAWIRQHPGRLTPEELAELASTAALLCRMAGSVQPAQGGVASTGTRAWRRLAGELSYLPESGRRLALPAAAHIQRAAEQATVIADAAWASGTPMAERNTGWIGALGRISVQLTHLAPLLHGEARTLTQNAVAAGTAAPDSRIDWIQRAALTADHAMQAATAAFTDTADLAVPGRLESLSGRQIDPDNPSGRLLYKLRQAPREPPGPRSPKPPLPPGRSGGIRPN